MNTIIAKSFFDELVKIAETESLPKNLWPISDQESEYADYLLPNEKLPLNFKNRAKVIGGLMAGSALGAGIGTGLGHLLHRYAPLPSKSTAEAVRKFGLPAVGSLLIPGVALMKRKSLRNYERQLYEQQLEEERLRRQGV